MKKILSIIALTGSLLSTNTFATALSWKDIKSNSSLVSYAGNNKNLQNIIVKLVNEQTAENKAGKITATVHLLIAAFLGPKWILKHIKDLPKENSSLKDMTGKVKEVKKIIRFMSRYRIGGRSQWNPPKFKKIAEKYYTFLSCPKVIPALFDKLDIEYIWKGDAKTLSMINKIKQ